VKTQIIQLERHDDAISVKDKMEWRQTPRILLVWPTRGKILNRRLDLVYLKRHASSLGAQLALVTHHSDIKSFAGELDIPVYPNTRRAEQSHWRRSRKHRKKRNTKDFIQFQAQVGEGQDTKTPNLDDLRKLAHPKTPAWLIHPVTRVFAFTLGVLGILAIAAIFIPSAEIHITPKTKTEKISIPVSAYTDITLVNLSGDVPARGISLIVEGRSSIPTTGKIIIPLNAAHGSVKFSNLTESIVPVPEGIIVTTTGKDPIRFITLEDVSVPPEDDSGLVPVQAVLPGYSSNTSPGEVVAIEGPIGLSLTVTNPGHISGGSDRTVPAPHEDDYKLVKDLLLDELYKSALIEFEYLIPKDDYILSVDPSNYFIIEEKYSSENTEPSDKLELELQIEFQALTAAGEDLYKLGMGVLEANVPEGYAAQPSTFDFENISAPLIGKNGEYIWDMEAQWQVKAQIDEAKTVQLVQWLKPGETEKAIVSQLPVQTPINVVLEPSWWPRLPILPFRISIIENQ